MFEDDIERLLKIHLNILERIEKGEQMVAAFASGEKHGETYDRYVGQLKYLKQQAYRSSMCVDILRGQITLIGQEGSTLVVAKADDAMATELALLADQYGGTTTVLDLF